MSSTGALPSVADRPDRRALTMRPDELLVGEASAVGDPGRQGGRAEQPVDLLSLRDDDTSALLLVALRGDF